MASLLHVTSSSEDENDKVLSVYDYDNLMQFH